MTPKRDMTHFVKWPKYVRLQRQRRVLLQRLKVPPQVNQFTKTLDRNTSTELFKLLHKYRPETPIEKKERLVATANKKVESSLTGSKDAQKKPYLLKFGLNHVTALIENKKTSLVVIAHDVTPIELVIWLPALCRHMDIPYCIVKGKARLGALVGQKTAAVVALTEVRAEDKTSLAAISTAVRSAFNDRYDENRRQWGGQVNGVKSIAKQHKLDAKKAKELQV